MHRGVVFVAQVHDDVFVEVGAQCQSTMVRANGKGPVLSVDEHGGMHFPWLTFQNVPHRMDQGAARVQHVVDQNHNFVAPCLDTWVT